MLFRARNNIRRFLLHVLPPGFHRIRHCGLFASRHRSAKLALCRQLLGMPPAEPASDLPADYRDRFEQLTGESLRQCPACPHGLMHCVETFQAGSQPPMPEDTS